MELASAYISILPETSKLASGIKRGLYGVESQASKDLGNALKGGVSSGIKSGAKEGSTSIKRAAQQAGGILENEVSDGISDGSKKGWSSLGKGAKNAGRKAGGTFKSGFSKMTSGLGGAAFGAIAAVGVGTMFRGFIDGATESMKVDKALAQVLKTTGANAWTSAGQIDEMVTKLSSVTGLDDEMIKSNTSVLLTFKNIKNEGKGANAVFDRTVTSAADLSALLGTDMKSSTMMLGKALNDPVSGMTKLSRSGITFTDAQKKQVKAMVANNDTLGAQKLILEEVESQSKGQAEAMATPWDKLKVTLGNLQETIGGWLLPVLNRMGEKLLDLAGWAETRLFPALETVGGVLKDKVVPPLSDMAGFLAENKGILVVIAGALTAYRIAVGLSAVATAYQAFTAKAAAKSMGKFNYALRMNPIGIVVTILALLAVGVYLAYKRFDTFRAIVNRVWAVIKNVAIKGFQVLWATVKWVFARIKWVATKVLWPILKGVFAAIKFYITKVVIPIFKFLWNNVIKPIFNRIADKIKSVWHNVIKPVFSALGDFIKNKVRPAFKAGVDRIGSIWESLKAKVGKPVNFVIGTLYNNGIRNAINLIPGIKDLKEAPLVKFAKGGVMPGYTPGRDVHQFTSPTGGRLALSGGEAIMRPEFTRAVGGARGVERLNRMARKGKNLGGYFMGGVLPLMGGSVSKHSSGYKGYAADMNYPGRADYGKPVRAWKAGTVSGMNYIGDRSYGRWVTVNHAKGYSLYAHLSGFGNITKGMSIPAGATIGYVGDIGNTGNPPTSHLHFEANGGAASGAAGKPGSGAPGDERMGFLNAIRKMPGNLKGVWKNIKGMATGSPWAQKLAGAGKGMLKSGAKYADNKIPNRFLPDNPLQGMLKKLGVYDNGGILKPGGLAYNASNKPEAVFNQRQFAKYSEGKNEAGRGAEFPKRLTLVVDGQQFNAYVRDTARDEIDGDKQFEGSRRRMNR